MIPNAHINEGTADNYFFRKQRIKCSNVLGTTFLFFEPMVTVRDIVAKQRFTKILSRIYLGANIRNVPLSFTYVTAVLVPSVRDIKLEACIR
jgi:hypothetical protein